jgi:hypothetical protein
MAGKVNQDKTFTVTNTEISFPFTFPAKGSYSIAIDGKPASLTSFKPFKISYDIDVNREQNEPVTNILGMHFVHMHLMHLIIFGGGIIVGLVLTFREKARS